MSRSTCLLLSLLLATVSVLTLSIPRVVFTQQHSSVALYNTRIKLQFADETASIANYSNDSKEPTGWELFPSVYWDSNNNGTFDADECIGYAISPSVHFTYNSQEHHFWPLHQSIMEVSKPHVVSSGWVSYPTIYKSMVEDPERLVTIESVLTLDENHFSQQINVASTTSSTITHVSLINYLGVDINDPSDNFAYIDQTRNNMLKACDNKTGIWFGAYPTTNATNYEISEWNDGPYESEDLWQHSLDNNLDGTNSSSRDIEGALQFDLDEIQANQSKSVTIHYSMATSESDLYTPNGIFVMPAYNAFYTYAMPPGNRFNVTAWVFNVSDLYAYQTRLLYDMIQLTARRAWIPTWDSSWVFYGRTGAANVTVPEFQNWVSVNSSLAGLPSFSGSGLLGIFEFEAKYIPTSGTISSNLEINNTDTYLLDSTMTLISAPKIDGYYECNYIEIHDTAITCVLPFKTIVCQGYDLRVNVTVVNQGTQTETVNVRIYFNTTYIQTSRTLTSGNTTTITFIWTTPTNAHANYTITAQVLPVQNETHILDNTLAGGVVAVTIVGDINADGKVDVKDVYAVGKAYGTSLQGPNPPGRTYNPNCDINGDNKIDVKDYYIVCRHYGEVDP